MEGEIEGIGEGIEEAPEGFKEIEELGRDTELTEDDIGEEETIYDQDPDVNAAIKSEIKDDIKEALEEVLESDHKEYGRAEIKARAATGSRIIENKTIQERPSHPPEGIKGSEGNPRGYSYPSEPENIGRNLRWPSGTTELTQREKLEARRDGLREFLERQNPSDYEREMAEQKMEAAEKELQELPEEPDYDDEINEKVEKEIRELTDEKAREMGYQSKTEAEASIRGTESHREMLEKLPREAKKSLYRDLSSIYKGFPEISELTNELDNIISDMGSMFG